MNENIVDYLAFKRFKTRIKEPTIINEQSWYKDELVGKHSLYAIKLYRAGFFVGRL